MDAERDKQTFTLTYAGICPNPDCLYMFPPIQDAARTYFEEGAVTCSQCKKSWDLWDVVLNHTVTSSVGAMNLVPLGVTQTHFTRVIEAGKYHEIRLEDVGIPPNATLLQVGYTPQSGKSGAVFPIEWHGNVPQRRRFDGTLRLIGQPVTTGDGILGSACPVAIFVLWMTQPNDRDEWPYIVNAFDAFVDRHYDRVLVPAQSAVEITLMPVARALLERHAKRDLVRQFTTDRLRYGDVVNIFLPFVCAQAGVAKLPEKIRLSLDKLRRKRNMLIHRGTVAASVSAQDAAEGLCAAVFGTEYGRYSKPKLLAWLK